MKPCGSRGDDGRVWWWYHTHMVVKVKGFAGTKKIIIEKLSTSNPTVVLGQRPKSGINSYIH